MVRKPPLLASAGRHWTPPTVYTVESIRRGFSAALYLLFLL
jgi:hypothetical protein